MIAALYVQPDGVYSRMEGIDLWPEARDARRYAGPWQVVEHPPCGPWGFAARRWRRIAVGKDHGCFEAAIAHATRWGGVIEHPAGSSAFAHYGLQRPGGWGWTPVTRPDPASTAAPVTVPGGDQRASGDVSSIPVTSAGGRHWVCAVDQGNYGHDAPKRTWLYLVTRTWESEPPPELLWGPSGAKGRVLDMPDAADREATPLAFAELLVDLVSGRDPSSRGAFDVPEHERCALWPSCHRPVPQARKGPRRIFCGDACRQRASRQRRAGGTIDIHHREKG